MNGLSEEYDLFVVGAGMAGTTAANRCAAQGWRVGIVDALPYGGTCALRGCDPKKILRRGAEVIDAAHLLQGKGITEKQLTLGWPGLMRHKRGFTDAVPQGMENELARNDVTTFHGTARFTGPRRLEIDGVQHEAKRFLVATGARPRPLAFPGHEHLIDSTDFLSLEALPARMVFVGGGFVSFEFAHIAARAGVDCVIIDRGERPLRAFDPDLVHLVVGRTEKAGINVHSSSSIRGYTGTPTTVFTSPELNRVGMLEHDARRDGRDVTVRYNDTSGWYANYRVGERTAATKVIIDSATDQIRGAHLLGPGYAELINILGLAIKLGLTTRQLKSMTATYPSVGSDLGSML